MANKTSIEWTDYNWNFLRGCSRISDGCKNCYAEGVAARFSGPGQPYEGLAKFVEHKPRWTGEIAFIEKALCEPLKWKKPRKVFVNSMSDLFHEKVRDEWLDKAFAVMALTPHLFQILTKRPERMREYFSKIGNFDTLEYCDRWDAARKWLRKVLLDKGERASMGRPEFVGTMMGYQKWPLPNVHLGVSVEDQKTADERIPILLNTPAAVRWLSVEPLLSEVNFRWQPYAHQATGETYRQYLVRTGSINHLESLKDISWIVVGAESGPNARPCKIEWIESIVDQCRSANVPVFVKQIQIDGKICKDIERFPEHLQIREFPGVKI